MLTLWFVAATLAAQTATATPRQNSPAKTPEKITITGCVERADEVASPSTLGTTVDSLSFVLINMPSSAPVGTSGVKGASASPTEKGYRLDADVAKLNPHVGHRVEISGYVDEPAATNAAASAANGPKVKVETIKMIAETCGR
jgi:hypothetical protein